MSEIDKKSIDEVFEITFYGTTKFFGATSKEAVENFLSQPEMVSDDFIIDEIKGKIQEPAFRSVIPE